MRPPRDRVFGVLAVLCILSSAATALASWIPRTTADVASAKRFCTASGGTLPTQVGLQCQANVRILSGAKLTDGGTKATSDGGQPITPGNSDELIAFPGDTYPVQFGTGEKCLGVVSADGGTNSCTFFDSSAP